MALSLPPVEAPRPIQRVAAHLVRGIAAHDLRTYLEAAPLDGFEPTTLRYCEALRSAMELAVVAAHRVAEASGEDHDVPRTPWHAVVADMVEFFRARTGVSIDMPETP